MTSRIPGLYRLPPHSRRTRVSDAVGRPLQHGDGLSLATADTMVENVISTFALPCGVGVNFRINGVDRVVPMVVEEPSVVAAVSHMAKLARPSGGFQASADDAVMIGQIQLGAVADPEACVALLQARLPTLEAVAREVHPRIEAYGGGLRKIEVRRVTYDEPGEPREEMVVVHVHFDCADAMGANIINTVAEQLAPHIRAITGHPVGLSILSNLADQRLARASLSLGPDVLATDTLDGVTVCQRIAAAWRFAWADPYRAATHNKGVMNGVDAVAIATGQDWRAIEAGAHAWCCRDGAYRPMSRWRFDGTLLQGSLEIPMQVGTVGGSIPLHPTVQANLALLDVHSAPELAEIMAAVGLAQNLGALRALATEGIQNGHMRMHARTVAASAGARGDEVQHVTASLHEAQDFSVERARRVLGELRRG